MLVMEITIIKLKSLMQSNPILCENTPSADSPSEYEICMRYIEEHTSICRFSL